MDFLVELKANVASDIAILFIEAVADVLQLPREFLEVFVVLGLDNKVVVFELVEVECVLDHVRVF